MYTGGWEVVGKNKKDKNATKNNKLSKVEKKKFIDNAPKVEDFLPLDQVKTLYDNLDGNKENKKPVKEKENKTKENEEKKKQQKPQQFEKKKEPAKEKLPKSIEEALNLINIAEVQNLVVTNQSHFPDAPLVWLKNLVTFLNAKIPIEKDDPLFSGRSDGYPLNIVPKNLRLLLERTIDSAGAQNARLFYEFTLTVMAMEMAKGIPVVGYKIFIQILAKHDPKLSISNVPKLISMRNSYQNRKSIGLSLLWSFNQGGREDLMIGLKVWHEVMALMLESKNYSIYVMRILDDLLRWHTKEDTLNSEIYFIIFDDLFSGKLNISSTVIDEGVLMLRKLTIILFQNKNINYRKLFETLLSKITSKTPENLRNEVLNALVGCLNSDDRCFAVWKSLYMKHLFTSSVLLTHIDSNWCYLQPSINSKFLLDILTSFQLSQEKSKRGKGKDDKYLNVCSNICQALNKKMSLKKSSKAGFPWKTGCFFFLLLISAIVAYDTHKHESFEATSTGKFMKDSGITAFVQKIWISTKLYSGKGLECLKAASPKYYKVVADFSTPYMKLAGDVYLITKAASIKLYENLSNYVATEIPIYVAMIEHYIPGLMDSVERNYLKAVELMKTYSALIAEQAVENSVKATRWLKTNIFVGKLSPESLQNYANQAINTTHTFVSQTYDWVYEKVQTLSKIE